MGDALILNDLSFSMTFLLYSLGCFLLYHALFSNTNIIVPKNALRHLVINPNKLYCTFEYWNQSTWCYHSFMNHLTSAVYVSFIFLFQFLLDLCDDELDVIMGLSISIHTPLQPPLFIMLIQ
jgi:hypothetical protein